MLVASVVGIRSAVFNFAELQQNAVDMHFCCIYWSREYYAGFPVKVFTSVQVFVFLTKLNSSCSFLHVISFAKKWLNYIVLDVKEINPFVYRIYNGNWTEWSAIWSEIIQVISKSNERTAQVRFEISSSMIWDQNCTLLSSITT